MEGLIVVNLVVLSVVCCYCCCCSASHRSPCLHGGCFRSCTRMLFFSLASISNKVQVVTLSVSAARVMKIIIRVAVVVTFISVTSTTAAAAARGIRRLLLAQ